MVKSPGKFQGWEPWEWPKISTWRSLASMPPASVCWPGALSEKRRLFFWGSPVVPWGFHRAKWWFNQENSDFLVGGLEPWNFYDFPYIGNNHAN